MSKTLYLIRHGHALHNELYPKIGLQAFKIPEVIDAPLTSLGREQCKTLRQDLQDIQRQQQPIEVEFVSPLVRALETASLGFHGSGIPIRCEECLREYPIGSDTCNQRSNITLMKQRFPTIDFETISQDRDIYWSEQRETMKELNQRIQLFTDFLHQRHEQTIAIVSHGSFLGQFKDNKIRYLENGDEELIHCHPYRFALPSKLS